MALLFMDGFDAADTSAKWSINSASTSSVSTRFGVGRSLGLGSGGTRFISKYFPPSAEIYLGFAASGMYHGSLNNIQFLHLYTDGGQTAQLNLVGNLNGSIAIRRGATQLAITAAGVVLTGWHYIEFYAKVDATAGAVELRVDGVTAAAFSGNTKSGGTSNNIDALQFTNSGSILGGLIDDFYMLDSTGSAPYNTFLGDVRIHVSVPSGPGNSTQLTPSVGANYTTVDELPYSATDYLSGTSPGLKDTFAMTDLPAGISTVFAVQTNVIAKKTDAGPVGVKSVVRSGGSDYASSNIVLNSYDTTHSVIRTQNPATSSAWSVSAVNNLETGVEIS